MSQVFDPHTHIKTIYVVGVGGTGSSAARVIARTLYDMNRRRQHIPRLILVDPDVVEAKNVGRQALFLPADMGAPKATTVARRLSFALGLDVGAVPAPFDPDRHTDRYGGNLIVSCVDNHAARQAIHRARGVHLGAGNHYNAGQCVIGTTNDADQVRHEANWSREVVRHLPTEGLLFPSLLAPEPPPTTPPAAACGEAVAAGDQSLLVNDWMATVIGGYVYRLLHRQPITSFITFVDAERGTVANRAVSRDNVLAYLDAE